MVILAAAVKVGRKFARSLASLVTLLWLALTMTGIPVGLIGRTARRRHQIASCRTYQQRLEKHGDRTPRVLKGPRSAESEIVTGGCSF